MLRKTRKANPSASLQGIAQRRRDCALSPTPPIFSTCSPLHSLHLHLFPISGTSFSTSNFLYATYSVSAIATSLVAFRPVAQIGVSAARQRSVSWLLATIVLYGTSPLSLCWHLARSRERLASLGLDACCAQSTWKRAANLKSRDVGSGLQQPLTPYLAVSLYLSCLLLPLVFVTSRSLPRGLPPPADEEIAAHSGSSLSAPSLGQFSCG